MFNTNAQCYQNISQVLLTSAFILWPTCSLRYSGKIRCGLRFFCVFLRGFCGFRTPLTPSLNYSQIPFKNNLFENTKRLYRGYQSFFSRVRRGASAATGRRHERRSREKNPRAQSALIYSAIWALTLSLICQSNRRSQD